MLTSTSKCFIFFLLACMMFLSVVCGAPTTTTTITKSTKTTVVITLLSTLTFTTKGTTSFTAKAMTTTLTQSSPASSPQASPTTTATTAPTPVITNGYITGPLFSVNSGGLVVKKASSTSPAIQLELGSLSSKQVFSMNDFLSGQLYLSESTGLCLDVYGSQTAPGTQVIQYPCSANVNQPNQAWVYNSKSMQMVSGLSTTANMYCLDINGLAGVQKLVLNHCSNSAASQKWSWYYKN